MKKRILAMILGLSMVFQSTALAAPERTEGVTVQEDVQEERPEAVPDDMQGDLQDGAPDDMQEDQQENLPGDLPEDGREEQSDSVEEDAQNAARETAGETAFFHISELPNQGVITVGEGDAEAAPEEEPQTESGNVNFEMQLQLDFEISQEKLEELELENLFIVRLMSKTEGSAEDGNHAHATLKSVSKDLLVFQAEDVTPGEYELSLSSEFYFQDFKQDVTIKEGTKTTLIFSNSSVSDRGEGKTSPGVYALGDLDRDGLIDKGDSELLLMHMGQTSTQIEIPDNPEALLEEDEEEELPEEVPNPEYNFIYDLNQDGTLDIGDLAILVYNMDQEKKEATPIETVLKSAVKVEKQQENAIPQGDRQLDSIMDDAEQPIQIAPKNGAEITVENPVEIAMEFQSSTVPTGGMVISAPAESGPTEGTITVAYEDPEAGQEDKVIEVPIGNESAKSTSGQAQAVRKADGSIVIDLGRQVAIKKVTILVTASATNTNLTEIAKVEFLNDMASRIPEPELNIPEDVQVNGSGDSFTVTWKPEPNVTGYEVAVSATDKDEKEYPEQYYKAGVNQITITSFKGGHKDKVTPLWNYQVRVKATNGAWSSPYSEATEHYQKAGEAPDAPDNVSINGKYRQLDVSWKDMSGTEKYTLEYRKKGTEAYTEVHDIMTNRYSITGLEDDTEYQVRVYGWNHDDKDEWRRGGYSVPAIGKTVSEVPKFPKYKMINDQIKDIKLVVNTPGVDFDPATFDSKTLIDGDYSTYFYTNSGGSWGADVTFEKPFTFKEMIMTNRLEDQYRDQPNWEYSGVSFTMYGEDGNPIRTYSNGQVVREELHPTAKNTIRFIMPEPVEGVTRVEFSLIKYGFGVSNGKGRSISELNFFEYDSLEPDVYGLFTDDMHIALKEKVTETQITELKKRATIKDAVNDEYHPKKALLESELEYAEKLLKDQNISEDILDVKANITKGGLKGIKFSSGLCGIQPLGYVAAAGQEINIYVGQKGKSVGDTTPVRAVFTQFHAESSAWRSAEFALHQGMNTITVPNISNIDNEKGGSIYIVHTNPAEIAKNPVKVRVSGARKIPKLELHRDVGQDRFSIPEDEWKEVIGSYVDELQTYVDGLKETHNEHVAELNTKVDTYDPNNCFLNYTEISLDNVLLSVPAAPILEGISRDGANRDQKVQNMYDTVVAMNQMIELFYKERGLNPATMNGMQGIPSARFNIRYQRMFAGAFMYAGGLHTGIEYGSVRGLAGGTPLVTEANGKRTGGGLFGWGIAHELGHNADGGNFSFAEVTNNIWAQFEKTWDTKDTSRIPYDAVYEHVTSGTVGKPESVFADLGLYWQLHLAYDKNYAHYNYYENGFADTNYQNMLENEFFARFYAIRRDWSLAPAPHGIKISEGSVDQNIMRTACAAAEKDLTDFFRTWGWEPDAATIAYAGQFEKEERQIQYLNDSAREYTLANPDPSSSGMISSQVNAELTQGTGKDARKVILTISLPEGVNMDAVLGYEILRNGKPVAFVEPDRDEAGSYTETTVYEDIVETANNRVMIYEVVAYDKYLQATEKKTLDAVKIRHEGDLPTDNWSVKSNATSDAGILHIAEGTKVEDGKNYTDLVTGESVTYHSDMDVQYRDKETGEVVETVSAARKAYDGNKEHGYRGTADSGKAYIDIDLGGKQEVLGLKYLGDEGTPGWSFVLEYSSNGGRNFTKISSFDIGESADGYPALYFKTDKNIKAVTATNIRIVSHTNKIGIKDLQLLGPSGDNVDIGISTIQEDGTETWNTENAIGLLSEDYILDATTGTKIPEGSFIVTGKYTGNAAYNVVKLYNQNRDIRDDGVQNKLDSIVNGYQTFFADMPEGDSIVNVKDGFWIYWLEPLGNGKFGLPGAGANGEDVEVELPEKVYAELYRVDDAQTLAGERFVSDSFMVEVPDKLPEITLTGGIPSEPAMEE